MGVTRLGYYNRAQLSDCIPRRATGILEFRRLLRRKNGRICDSEPPCLNRVLTARLTVWPELEDDTMYNIINARRGQLEGVGQEK